MNSPTSQIDAPPLVCVDFKNPKAYLALRPTFALEDELDIGFDWLPLIVSPISRPHAVRPDEDRGTRHRRMRAEYNERDLRRYGRVYGLELGDLYRNPDVSVASIGLLWTKQHAPEKVRLYLTTVFDRYWSARLEIGDVTAIGRLMDELVIDTVGWTRYLEGTGPQDLDQISAELREAGLFDVPAYRVGGEIFFGRQHLPMIRSLLSGGQEDFADHREMPV